VLDEGELKNPPHKIGRDRVKAGLLAVAPGKAEKNQTDSHLA
jgi:hypothetical protein